MKTLPLYKSELVALVDDEDFDRLKHFRYCLHRGYPVRYVYKTMIYLHHDVLDYSPVLGFEAHHKDDNILNAQKENIEVITMAAHRQTRSSGRSKYIGVFLNTISGDWRAKVKKNGIQYHAGSYGTEEEAAKARDQKAFELFGLTAKFNFPDDFRPPIPPM